MEKQMSIQIAIGYFFENEFENYSENEGILKTEDSFVERGRIFIRRIRPVFQIYF